MSCRCVPKLRVETSGGPGTVYLSEFSCGCFRQTSRTEEI